MNAPSLAILAIVLALAGLAARRAWKRGVPCSCGCSGCGKCKSCSK